ncbi:MAG: protein translocase subunit SecD, partial [Bacteroidia bacterium]|nr:protein translocase subunit SecD [Bacteroidia bacterium]
MQGKGLIRFFLGLMLIICIYQFFLYIPTNKVEKQAEEYATSIAQDAPDEEERRSLFSDARRAYLDSMSTEKIFGTKLIKEYTYNELKQQQLAFGLDLSGGMSVVLQVDIREFLYALSDENKDATFIQALDNAEAELKNSQSDFVTIFADEFQQIAEGKSLANIFNKNQALRQDINFDTPDGEVISLIRTKANETVQLTFQRLKERIDKLGVVQPNVSLDAARDLIIVELPGIDNPERARSFLQAAAKLEFWNVYRVNDAGIIPAFLAADSKLANLRAGEEVEEEAPVIESIDTIYAQSTDADGNITIDSTDITIDTLFAAEDPFASNGPLLSLLTLNGTGTTLNYALTVMGTSERNARGTISAMLEEPAVKALFPNDVIFRWSKDPVKDITTGDRTTTYELYAIKKERGKDGAPLEGDMVIDASAQPDPTTGQVQVSLKMDNKGAAIWGQMTSVAAADNNREIAILLDDEVVSAPRVINAILTGDSQITGDFTIQEGQDLASILQIGKLPAQTKIIQEKNVGPSLGAENIARSKWALIIGSGMVLLFMLLYYAGAGIVSIVALVLNIVFIFAALASYGTVLTLPGIAGIVLTIGMAVDANVIIFERIREELRSGKSTATAIADGFKFSYSAIIDANVTTIITALVLAKFGLGPIKGFAIVLIIGVLSSLFTAVLVGRMIFDWWTSKGRDVNFATSISRGALSKVNIDWIGKRKIAYVISGTIIAAGFVSFATRGFDFGVDFKGGYSYNVALSDDSSLERDDVYDILNETFAATTTVKEVENANTFDITTSYGVDIEADDVDDQVMQKLHEGFSTLLATELDYDDFKNPNGVGTHVESSYKIRPTIADDIRTSSYYAGTFALLLIFLYIFIRFNKWQYSLGAVAALAHDVLIVLSIFSIFKGLTSFSMEIDQNFIAAILTVIGYSINDTVVVFDRIREF